MPKLEYYTTLDGRREFASRGDYLDYLRFRRRHRLAQRRLDDRRQVARERLADFRNCLSVAEMQQFLNDHLPDLEILDEYHYERRYTGVKLRLSPDMVFDRVNRTGDMVPGWKGHYQYEYVARKHRRETLTDSEKFNLYDIRDRRMPDRTLDILGMECRGGSGMSPFRNNKTGYMCNAIHMMASDFPGMRVFDRLGGVDYAVAA